jgi:hypothetical protein
MMFSVESGPEDLAQQWMARVVQQPAVENVLEQRPDKDPE